MTCPRCGQEMEETGMRNVTVQRCTSCEGVWFDAGELAAYRRSLERGLEMPRGVYLGFEPKGLSSDLRCPKCRMEGLETGRVGGHLGVTKCPKCYGVFVRGSVLRTLREKIERQHEHEEATRDSAEGSMAGGALPAVLGAVVDLLFGD